MVSGPLFLFLSQAHEGTEQARLLLQTPTLLNSLLNISISRNWLWPTLGIMRLHAYLAQALTPGDVSAKYAQLPGIEPEEAKALSRQASAVDELIGALGEKDGRVAEVKKAASRWGRLDLVDASFKGVYVSPVRTQLTVCHSCRGTYHHSYVICIPRRQATCRTTNDKGRA